MIFVLEPNLATEGGLQQRPPVGRRFRDDGTDEDGGGLDLRQIGERGAHRGRRR